MKHELLKTENGYSFWKLTENKNTLWNITPETTPPKGGYRSKLYIEKIKHQTFDEVTA